LGNGYTYANNNPWSNVDPSGLCAQTIKNAVAGLKHTLGGLWDTLKKMESNAERGLAEDGSEVEVAKGWFLDPIIGLATGAFNSALGAATNPLGAPGEAIKQAIGVGRFVQDIFENPDTYKAKAIEWAGDPRHIGELGSQTLLAAGGAFVGGEAVAGRAAGLAEEAAGAANAARVAEDLAGAASRAAESVGSGSGPAYGTRVHAAFKQEVLGMEDFSPEVSYLNGAEVKYGTPGSVRVDAIYGPRDKPLAIYDLKTGGASLTQRRIQQIQSHIPGGSSVPVTEVRP
jgi:hypothetical protein